MYPFLSVYIKIINYMKMMSGMQALSLYLVLCLAMLSVCMAWRSVVPVVRCRNKATCTTGTAHAIHKNIAISMKQSSTCLHESKSGADMSALEQTRRREVQDLLQTMEDPSTKQALQTDSVQAIDISSTGDISIRILYPAGKTSAGEELKKMMLLQLSMLDWANKVEVDVVSNTPSVALSPQSKPVIKHTIAVSSCKGGVGKSTTSVNLAYSLRQQGFKVGILDADIFGPSLPTMTKADTSTPVIQGQAFIPLEYEGVKLMSMGYLNRGAAIMRGPMVNQVLNQLITLTKWGDLDYLVIDMPPGTGDVQLTLAQALNISAAVIVTTPQRLSFVDVVKGIDMFDTVNVPSIAVVENMASYMSYDFSEDFFHHLAKKIVENGDQSVKKLSAQLQESVQKQKLQRRIFGEGHNPKLKTMWGMENIISVPLVEDISQCGDKGTPFVLQFPQSEVAKTYQTLANIITSEITRLSAPTKDQITAVNFDDNSKTIKLNGGAAGEVNSKDLRCNCRCAVCVEELTGKKLLKDETISPSVRPLGMAPIGRYAWSVDWSDGHKSLYPFKQLSALAKAPSVAS